MGLFFVLGAHLMFMVGHLNKNQSNKCQNSWISTVCFNTVFDIY